MSNYSEILGLPSRDLELLANSYRGYAAALRKQEGSKINLQLIASSYAISAIFQLISEPGKAPVLFHQAAKCYREFGLPVWVLYAICSNNYQQLLDQSELPFFEKNGADQHNFYYLLQQYFFSTGSGHHGSIIPRHDQMHWDEKYLGKIDRLNIPFNFIVKVMNESEHWRTGTKRPKLIVFPELIRRLNELTELKQADQFHWRNLQGTVLPVEPAALALTVMFLRRWLDFNSYNKLMIMLELNKLDRSLLDMAHELITSSGITPKEA